MLRLATSYDRKFRVAPHQVRELQTSTDARTVLILSVIGPRGPRQLRRYSVIAWSLGGEMKRPCLACIRGRWGCPPPWALGALVLATLPSAVPAMKVDIRRGVRGG
jgi:hypothetical protein